MNQLRTAHTPGPWRVINYSSTSEIKGFIAVVGSNEVPEHICDVFPFGHRPGGIKRELEQHAANARLIAAAPAMLEALRYAEKGLALADKQALEKLQKLNPPEDESIFKGPLDAARAAIALATEDK